jgi:hypothetical protein
MDEVCDSSRDPIPTGLRRHHLQQQRHPRQLLLPQVQHPAASVTLCTQLVGCYLPAHKWVPMLAWGNQGPGLRCSGSTSVSHHLGGVCCIITASFGSWQMIPDSFTCPHHPTTKLCLSCVHALQGVATASATARRHAPAVPWTAAHVQASVAVHALYMLGPTR